MNNKVDEIIRDVQGLSHDRRVEFCQTALGRLIDELSVNDRSAISAFVLHLIRVAVSADRKCGQAEYDLFCDIFGPTSPEEFFEQTNGGASEEYIRALDQEIDHFTDDAKFAACAVVLSFLTADGEVTREEAKLMHRLFE